MLPSSYGVPVAMLDVQLCDSETTASGLSERSRFPLLRKTYMSGRWFPFVLMLAAGLQLCEMRTCSTGLGLGLLQVVTIAPMVVANVLTPGLGRLATVVDAVRWCRRPLSEIGKFPYMAAVLKTLLLCSMSRLNIEMRGRLGLISLTMLPGLNGAFPGVNSVVEPLTFNTTFATTSFPVNSYTDTVQFSSSAPLLSLPDDTCWQCVGYTVCFVLF